MKVSVVVATFNGEKYIGQQLRSIAAQSVPPDEILVQDDRSTDLTLSIVERLRDELALPLKVLTNGENLGYAANFLAGIGNASGDYIFLADQDDYWFPGKIRAYLEHFVGPSRPKVIIGNQMLADEDLRQSGVTSIENILRSGRDLDSFVHGCCTAFDARLSPLVRSKPEDLGHDDWIHMLGTALNSRMVLSEVFQLYRRHDGTVTSSAFNGTTPVRKILLRRVHLFRSAEATARIVVNLRKKIGWLLRLEETIHDLAPRLCRTAAVEEAILRTATKRQALERRAINIGGDKISHYGVLRAWWRGDYGGLKGAGVALQDLLSAPSDSGRS